MINKQLFGKVLNFAWKLFEYLIWVNWLVEIHCIYNIFLSFSLRLSILPILPKNTNFHIGKSLQYSYGVQILNWTEAQHVIESVLAINKN